MADVVMDIRARTEDVENKLNKLQGEFLKLKERMAETTKSTREGKAAFGEFAAEGSKALNTMLAAAGGVTTGVLSISGVVGATVKGFEEWRRKMDEIAEQSHDLDRSLTGTLAKMGMVQNAKALRQWAEASTITTGATTEQIQTAYGALAEALPPGQVSEDRRRAIALQMATHATAFGEELGPAAKEAAGLSTILTKATPQQLASVQQLLRQEMKPELRSQLTSPTALLGMQQLIARGESPEDILGLATALGKQNVDPAMILKVLGAVAVPKEAPPVQRGHRLSEAEASEARFAELAKTSPHEALRALFEDKQIQQQQFGRRFAPRAGAVGVTQWQQESAKVLSAEQTDLTFKVMAGVPESLKAEQLAAAGEDKARIDRETRSENMKAATKARKARQAIEGFGWVGTAYASTKEAWIEGHESDAEAVQYRQQQERSLQLVKTQETLRKAYYGKIGLTYTPGYNLFGDIENAGLDDRDRVRQQMIDKYSAGLGNDQSTKEQTATLVEELRGVREAVGSREADNAGMAAAAALRNGRE